MCVCVCVCVCVFDVYKFIHNINKIIKYMNSLHLKGTRLKE